MTTDEMWPVTSSPVTGPPHHRRSMDFDIDVDEIVNAISHPLIEPAPLKDKALEDEP